MPSIIIWDVNPEIIQIGSFSIRWYGLLFALAFLIGQQIMYKIYELENKSKLLVDTLTIWMVTATVIGARLGHCIFYEPDIYLKDPIRILKIWEGGLASHGAAIAIILAIWFYSKKYKDQPFLWLLDRLVITIALAGAFIRLGNLMNSEIIGKTTQCNFGFVFTRSVKDNLFHYFESNKPHLPALKKISFEKIDNLKSTNKGVPMYMRLHFSKSVPEQQLLQFSLTPFFNLLDGPDEDDHNHVDVDPQTKLSVYESNKFRILEMQVIGKPRHPAQLYESVSCIILMIILGSIYLRLKNKVPNGLLLGFFMFYCFTLRFFYEFLKENQVSFENRLILNMGQTLSIPFIIIGIFLIGRSFYYQKHKK